MRLEATPLKWAGERWRKWQILLPMHLRRRGKSSKAKRHQAMAGMLPSSWRDARAIVGISILVAVAAAGVYRQNQSMLAMAETCDN